MNVIRKLRKAKFELIRKCHLLRYDYIFKKLSQNSTPIPFTCNICGDRTEALLVDMCGREISSCNSCGSNLRMRSVIHLLSAELFGESIPLPDFPKNKNIFGWGMSDRDEYARLLAEKFSYTNTFYHKEPKFDITSIDRKMAKKFDFMLSCDVFEHVRPPTIRSFSNLHYLLKDGGVAIITVPYMLFEETWEHFPELDNFKIVNDSVGPKLINTTQRGQKQEFRELIFHGGDGSTLELRIFTKSSLHQELAMNGFKDVEFCKCNVPEYGIFWPISWSLPIKIKK